MASDLERVRALSEALRAADSDTRADAAEALASLGETAEPAVPALLGALDDRSFLVQLWAVRALGAIGPRASAAVPRLLRALEDPALAVFAALSLGKIGSAARPASAALKRLAAHPGEELSEAAAMALFRIEGDRDAALSVLVPLVEHGKDATARMHAAHDLGETGDPLGVPILAAALSDPASGVRREAAYALGALGGASAGAVQKLEQALFDPKDDGVRLCAAEALWKIEHNAAGVAVLSEIMSPEGTFRTGHPDVEGAPPPAHKDPAARARAARALGAMGEKARAAVAELERARSDADEEVKRAAEAALRSITGG